MLPGRKSAGIGGQIPQEISDDRIYSFFSGSLLDEALVLEVRILVIVIFWLAIVS